MTIDQAKRSAFNSSTADLLSVTDPVLAQAISAEEHRQIEHLELIASENYCSSAARAAQASVLTNKYAEGYPGKRYYGGCSHVDVVEQLAIDRAQKLFGACYANVQPHSGASANIAALLALAKPGESVIGMALDHGGHLTHGSPVNFSGKLFDFHHYGTTPEHDIDYDQLEKTALSVKPKVIIGGFSAWTGVADWKRMRSIADAVGAYLMVDMAHVAGLVAGGVYPSPLPHAHVVTSTTHKTLRGPRGGIILSADKDAKLHRKLNSAVFPGGQGGPLQHVIAAKAVSLGEALAPEFAVYQHQVVENAKILADHLRQHQFTLLGDINSHLVLVDLREYLDGSISGKDAQDWLEDANITLNRNAIANDPRPPMVTSGVRIGTPAITTRGMSGEHMPQIAEWIATVLSNKGASATLESVGRQVRELTADFPVP